MKRSSYKIFSNGVIADLTFKNRLVRAATFEGVSIHAGVTDEIIKLYRKLAEGGIGLIITGALFAMSPWPGMMTVSSSAMSTSMGS